MNTLSVQPQFKVSTKTTYDFHPEIDKPKCFQLFLNSQETMSGANANATFKADILPDMFKTDRLNVRLNNFITSSPSGMSNGIAHIALTGVENPFSYHSSNQNTHQVPHTIRTSPNATILREYPPAALTGDTTILSNQAYGNGT